MAIQLINIGSIANDGTGDDLREAFLKVNQNFEELDLRDDEMTSASNLGTVGAGIFAQKLNYDLQFKRLIAGTDVTLATSNTGITINADGGLKSLAINTDNGSLGLAERDEVFLYGGTNISTTLSGNTITISHTGWSSLVDDTAPQLGGDLDAQGYNLTNVGNVSGNILSGTTLRGNLEGTVYGIDVRDLSLYFNNYWDFGVIGSYFPSIFQWIIDSSNVDMGTILSPEDRNIDLGILS